MRDIVAILHNIRSLHNVGSMFRTADGAGTRKLYLAGITPSPNDTFGKERLQMTKVSLGAEKYVDWEKAVSTLQTIEMLRKKGFQIIAIEQSKNAVSYARAKLNPRRVALIVGNEVEGLPANILKRADMVLEIPMRGEKESLNVSVAFGIVAFHVAAQK